MVAVSLKKDFFQAEDGIRDYKVTGVQTCALPIWPAWPWASRCTSRSPCARWTRGSERRDPLPAFSRKRGGNASSTQKWQGRISPLCHSCPQLAFFCHFRPVMAEGPRAHRPLRGRSGIYLRISEIREIAALTECAFLPCTALIECISSLRTRYSPRLICRT